jgi:hypothetical protein
VVQTMSIETVSFFLAKWVADRWFEYGSLPLVDDKSRALPLNY